jgi:large subunit ribosomal protein L23
VKLLDFFHKREQRKKLQDLEVRKPESAAKTGAEAEVKFGSGLGFSQNAGLILNKPHITEKSSFLKDRGVYVFRVAKAADKAAIKKTIQELYKVKVIAVRIINAPSRRRRVGRYVGRRPGYKKTIVKLAPGQKIELT